MRKSCILLVYICLVLSYLVFSSMCLSFRAEKFGIRLFLLEGQSSQVFFSFFFLCPLVLTFARCTSRWSYTRHKYKSAKNFSMCSKVYFILTTSTGSDFSCLHFSLKEEDGGGRRRIMYDVYYYIVYCIWKKMASIPSFVNFLFTYLVLIFVVSSFFLLICSRM